MTSLDARLFGRGVRSERVALLRLRLSFPSSGSRLFRSPAPNTYWGSSSERCGRSVPQKLVGSLTRPVKDRAGSSASWLRARARGRARWRGALRRPTNVRRGEGSPIKRTGCRASAQETLAGFAARAAIPDLRIAGRPLRRAWPWLPEEARLQLGSGITPLRSFQLRARNRSLSNARSLLSMK